jgi:hypothetical protein
MTIEDVVSFVSNNPGRQIPTVGGHADFTVKTRGEKAFIFITQSGTKRNENHTWIGKSLKVYNATGSLQLRGYKHTRNGSYVLGLFKAIRADSKDTDLPEDLSAIISLDGVDKTTKQALIAARVGQGKFRESVLRMWNNRCAVTSSSTREAIRASHIKPWRDSTNVERLDPANGLPLVANLDALFDAGLISFENSGRMIVSSLLKPEERAIYGLAEGALLKPLPPETINYLQYHRANRLRA